MTGRVVGLTPAACGVCGSSIPANARVCPACGAPAAGAYIAPATQEYDVWRLAVDRLRDVTRGEFEIQRELGRGGMAAVYLAQELTLARQVAIKLMSPRLMADPDLVARFRQEAVTVANLSHPHIVTIHAVRQADDLHFFTMKFVEGRSLDHVVHGAGALPVRMVRALLFMVGSALGYAHRHGVVHRDVKPGNVLLDGDGNALVTDFGIAKVAQDAAASQPHLTQTGTLIGTPAYISPEQCYGQTVSPASDQYSLGVLAYELLTGHPPFTGSAFTVMQAHTERPVPPLREACPDCPPDLEAAVLRMLEKEPAKRWPSMQHALAALDARPLADHDELRAELAMLALPENVARSGEVLALRVTPTPAGAPPPYVASVDILAAPAEVQVGESIALGAAPRNAAGATMPGARVIWSSTRPTIAAVDPETGMVRAVAEGECDVSATAGGVSGTVHLRVVARRAAWLTIAAPSGPIRAGDRVQLVVAPVDRAGEPVVDSVRWSCATPMLAQISEDGTLTALAEGTALVWAEANGVRATAHVVILPARVASVRLGTVPPSLEVGAQLSVGATPLDEMGRPIAGRAATWLSSDPSLASVSGSGVVSAHAPGTVLLTCTCEEQTSAIELEIVVVRVAAVRVDRPTGVRVGEPFVLDVEALSAHGRPVAADLEFHSTAPDVAVVDEHGAVTPLAAGEVTIIARTGGAQGMATFVVESPRARKPKVRMSRRELRRNLLAGGLVAAVLALALFASLAREGGEATQAGEVVRPSVPLPTPVPPPTTKAIVGVPASVAAGDTFTASAANMTGARWTSSDTTVLTVDAASGLVRTRRAGAAELLAVAGADSVRAAVAVGAPTNVSIKIIRQAPFAVNETRTLRLRVTAQEGITAPPAPAATWTSRAPSVLEVDAQGKAKALREGTVVIVAMWPGGSDSVAVTIAGMQVARLEVQPSEVKLAVGDSTQLRATAFDAKGATVANAEVSFASEDGSVVEVSRDGWVHARAVGSLPLTVRAGPARASVTVTVRESEGMIRRQLLARADDFVSAINQKDAERLRAFFAPDDAWYRNLVDMLGKKDVKLRGVSRAEPSVGEGSAQVDVRVEVEVPRGGLRRIGGGSDKKSATYRVSVRHRDGEWHPTPVATVTPFR